MMEPWVSRKNGDCTILMLSVKTVLQQLHRMSSGKSIEILRTRWVSAKLLGRPHPPKIASNASSMPLDHLWYTILQLRMCRALKGVSLGSKLYAVRIITSKASTATSFKVSPCVRPSWNSPYNAVLSGLERLANGARRNGTRCPSGPTTATASQRSSSASQLSHLLSWACEPNRAKASDIAHFAEQTLHVNS